DHSVQRIDLIARAIATPGAERPVVAQAASVLERGGGVWLVGFPLFADRAASADRRHITAADAADARWCSALAAVLQRQAHHATVIVNGGNDVSIYERVNVTLYRR